MTVILAYQLKQLDSSAEKLRCHYDRSPMYRTPHQLGEHTAIQQPHYVGQR